MVGDRRVGSVDEISRETRQDQREFMIHGGPKSPLAGVRAFIVAVKPGNAGGAKGRREVETQST